MLDRLYESRVEDYLSRMKDYEDWSANRFIPEE